VVADVELVVDREVADPEEKVPLPLVPEAALLLPALVPLPVLPPPALVLPLPPPDDAWVPEPPVPVVSPPAVELIPPPGPVFDVPDPPHAATMAAANATLTVRPWSMLLQGLAPVPSRRSKRRRRP
jgi:hypothetical protein